MSADPLRDLIIGESRVIVELRAAIHRFAACNARTLIQGPTGSGKELVARALHDLSGRPGRFVVVNVSAVPDSMFEDAFFGHTRGAFTGATFATSGYLREADRGTLFLDEIGSLSIQAQAKLLRAIETGTFRPVGGGADVHSEFRAIAATNEPLDSLVQQGRFRADLMYRLRGFVLQVPSLLERIDDIPLLVEHFLASGTSNGRRVGVEPAAMAMLTKCDWRGNVRELRSVIDVARMLATAATISRNEMRFALDELGVQTLLAPAGNRRDEFCDLLERFDWDTARVAHSLGIHRGTVYRWMKQLGIVAPRLSARRNGALANRFDGHA